MNTNFKNTFHSFVDFDEETSSYNDNFYNFNVFDHVKFFKDDVNNSFVDDNDFNHDLLKSYFMIKACGADSNQQSKSVYAEYINSLNFV